MLLLDIHSTVPMPVPGFLNQSERDVPEQQEENLEAQCVGGAFPLHDYAVSDTAIMAVGPAGAEKNELYAVHVEGSPMAEVNRVFVTAARKLLSFNDDEPYPDSARLDYDPNAGPPRPAVVRALTKELTKNNGSGKSLPHIVAL